MVELRWKIIEETHKTGIVGEIVCTRIAKVLQYRQAATANVFGFDWSEWIDVPEFMEKEGV